MALKWSSQLLVAPRSRTPQLLGDKILLPQSALEQLLSAAPVREVARPSARSYTSNFDPFNPYTFAAEAHARAQDVDRQQQLPHPLTFRIVNPQNGRVVYAGIREFSATEYEVALSPFLRNALGIEEDDTLEAGTTGYTELGGVTRSGLAVTVHAQQLPKGTYVRLRPLEAGYEAEDWKALLERYLRENFTTLMIGEVLTIRGTRNESYQFLVDRFRPPGDGICVVDTDLEVDIEALSAEQARETLKKRLEKASTRFGTGEGSSEGGLIALGEDVSGQVVGGEYVDYELQSWDRGGLINVDLEVTGEGDVDLLASPFSLRQRSRPRMDEHVFADVSSGSSKHITIGPANVQMEDAETIYISVHMPESSDTHDATPVKPVTFKIRVSSMPPDMEEAERQTDHDPGDVQCTNCWQWVNPRTLILHENFCLRNNVVCDKCGRVFHKRSAEWENHWHCALDSYSGDDAASKQKHDRIFHQRYSCANCAFEFQGLLPLAQHRTSNCPGKLILCQFCHLVVPQKGDSDPDLDDPEVVLSGLTPHELIDGGRTTECHLCNKIVRLRELKSHLRHHDLDRLSRPTPLICTNRNCGRTVNGRTNNPSSKNDGNTALGLCSICFGPLYVDTYDPDGKALRRRIERRYLSQMMTGCGKPWCQNEYCKTGRQNQNRPSTAEDAATAAEIVSLLRPLTEAINFQTNRAPFYFCTDQASQQRRILAETMAAEGAGSGKRAYSVEWCVAAVEAAGGDLDKAREWLANWAPALGESMSSFGRI